MPMSSRNPIRAVTRRPNLDDADDAYERVIPFARQRPTGGRTQDSQDASRMNQRSRRDLEEPARAAPGERRVRRRRQTGPWLQRNALSLAAVGALVVLLGVGFALAQLLNRGDSTPAGATSAAGSASATIVAPAANAPTVASTASPPTVPPAREIRSSVKVLEANYTVQTGDSVASIALRFNTTIQRIQVFNNLADPSLLSVGQQLFIPPPL